MATIGTHRKTWIPGSVLKVSLDNENGNLVYSVEIKTAANAIQDVKVDAGTAKVLAVDAGGEDTGNDEGGNGEGGADEGATARATARTGTNPI